MARQDRFNPPWWMRNGHVQSCIALVGAPKLTDWQAEEILLPDDDFLDVWWYGPADGPIILMLHGLEGSVQSHYMQITAQVMAQQGWRVCGMHYRGCSGRMNRAAYSYHAGETGDLSHVINSIHERYPARQFCAIGFSMGGNMLLKYLHENPDSILTSAVAVSVPFEIDTCLDQLAPFYTWRFLRSMKQKSIEKLTAGFSLPATEKQIKAVSSFAEFDNLLTAPMHGFKDAQDYYVRSSCRYLLHDIQHPVLIMHALDDPFIPACCVPKEHEVSRPVTLEVSDSGGHLGFVQASRPWSQDSWLARRIPEFLRPYCVRRFSH